MAGDSNHIIRTLTLVQSYQPDALLVEKLLE
jgi:hypothetical protein